MLAAGGGRHPGSTATSADPEAASWPLQGPSAEVPGLLNSTEPFE